jgi:hypothetical protein
MTEAELIENSEYVISITLSDLIWLIFLVLYIKNVIHFMNNTNNGNN